MIEDTFLIFASNYLLSIHLNWLIEAIPNEYPQDMFDANAKIIRIIFLVLFYVYFNEEVSRSQLIWIYTVCRGRAYPGSAGLGLMK